MLLLLLLLTPFARCTSVVDTIPTYEHPDQSTGKTLLCTQCPPGTYMAAHCTPSTPTQCVPCGENQFTELWNYLPRCLFCSNVCYEDQEVEKECSATSNRVCRCKDGFYWSSGFCFRHSECEPGQGVKTKGTSNTDTVCAHCGDGYFSNSSSAKEPCVKHQECAAGQTRLLSGSDKHDAVCGTCEELTSMGETYRAFITGFFSKHRMRVGKMRRFVARYMNTSNRCVPKQRGALLEQLTSWQPENSHERLQKLRETLKAMQLNSTANKLEKIFSDIQQRNPGCSLI